MTEVVVLGGRRFVAGLFWTKPGAEIDPKGRRQWAWSVELGEQTGWIPKEAGLRGLEGAPSLAASLAEHIGGSGDDDAAGWVALLAAEDGRSALVRMKDGAIRTDGDQVFENAETAEDTVASARAEGAQVYGTAGAITDGGGWLEVDVGRLPEGGDEAGLKRTGSGKSRLKVAGLSAAFLLLGVGAVAMLAPDMLFGLVGGGQKAVMDVVEVVEAEVSARIENGALVRACSDAEAEWPPYMPAWELTSVACYGWFLETELIGLRPELEGRAVMLVRWELPGKYVAALHRRIAEEHLAAWYLASVVERRAWAVVLLDPVLGRAEGEAALPYLEFRRQVDRHLGMQGAHIDYSDKSGVVEVTVGFSRGLGRIEPVVADVPGFELVSLSRSGRGMWVLKGRQVASVWLKESLYWELAGKGSGGKVAAF